MGRKLCISNRQLVILCSLFTVACVVIWLISQKPADLVTGEMKIAVPELDFETIESLFGIAVEAQPWNDIILVIVHTDAESTDREWITNFMHYATKVGVNSRVVTIGLTPATCDTAQLYSIPCYTESPLVRAWYDRIGLPWSLQLAKPYYIQQFVQRGYNVLLLDWDVVLLRNPFQDLDRNSFDIQAQSDSILALHGPEAYPLCQFGATGCLNAGIMYLRSTGRTKQVLLHWVWRNVYLKQRGVAWDQEVLNDLIYHNLRYAPATQRYSYFTCCD